MLMDSQLIDSMDEEQYLTENNVSYQLQQAQVYNYDEIFPALPDIVLQVENDVLYASNIAKSRIESSFVTQVLEVPLKEMKYLDSQDKFGGQNEKTKVCSEILQKTGAKIEISSSKDHSLTFLITGKVEAVKQACYLIEEKFQLQTPSSIAIPKGHHRHILGKQGKKLKDLEKLTGTRIKIPPLDDASETILIRGPKEGIDKAVEAIQSISQEQGRNCREEVVIPVSFHPFIRGAYGKRLDHIMSEYHVYITLPQTFPKKDTFVITGEADSVVKAKEAILKIYNDMQSRTSTVTANISKDKHKYLLGVKGSGRAEFLEKFNVSVELPPSDSDSETVTLRGLPEHLGEALSLAYSKTTSMKTATVAVPLWLHKYIIGRKGSQIQQFTRDYPEVSIKCAKEEDLISIEGPIEDVDKVQKEILNKVNDLLQQFSCDEVKFEAALSKQLNAHPEFIRMKKSGVIKDVMVGDGNLVCVRLEGASEDVSKIKGNLEKLIQKLLTEDYREIYIQQKYHRNLIGPKGEKIRELREQFRVKIIIPDADAKEDIITIVGHRNDVENCCKYLKEFYCDLLENSHEFEMQFPKDFYQFLSSEGIGKVKEIEEQTCTKIRCIENESGNGIARIIGRKDNVEQAKDLLKTFQKSTMITVIIIPHKFHSVLIGAGGKLIKSVEEEFSVKIHFPAIDSGSDKVTIIGSKDAVNKAKRTLIDMSNEKQLSNYSEEIKAKPEIHKFLIGKNGVNIKKVKDAYDIRVAFPSESDSDKSTIAIIGKKENVKKARTELENIIKVMEKEVTEEVNVPSKHHIHFVGRNAKVLKDIRDHCEDVRIQFPEKGTQDNTVILKGMKESVSKAKQMILDIVSDLEQRITMHFSIPLKDRRVFFGAKRGKVQEISSVYDVEIKFPDRLEHIGVNGAPLMNGSHEQEHVDEKQYEIVLLGKAEACKAAKDELISLIPVTKEVNVPFELHRYIIGKKGQDIRTLMQTHEVSISVSPISEQSNIIQVTGQVENVEKACEDILHRVRELQLEFEDREARKFQCTLDIDPKYHSRIIGRKGEVINKIRNDHDVQIHFPKKDEPDENIITITGYESNAMKAAEHIRSIVNELENMIEEEVVIDQRFRPRLIGQKGRNIRRLMDQFKVDIRFPRSGEESENPDVAYISGPEERVLDAKYHIETLAQEFMDALMENEWLEQYIRTGKTNHVEENGPSQGEKVDSSGFLVKGGPWDQKSSDTIYDANFPSFGSSSDAFSVGRWGPRH